MITKNNLLTFTPNRDYSFAQVLSTPKLKRYIASDIVIFFRPLFSMVGRAANKRVAQAANMPADFSRLITPDLPHIADGQLPIKELKIMSTKSKAASATPKARTRRKSVSKPIQLTSWMIEDHARRQALQEIHDFMDNWTDAERRIAGHVVPWGDPVNGMKEIRRLLGESIAKCKVIPFPVRNHQSKSSTVA